MILTKQEVVQMQIKRIEKEIRDTPYHKGTEHYIGLLRAKLSKLREKLYGKKEGKGGGLSFAIKKQGEATVALIGPPSVGKSSLINQLCNIFSPVGSYDFTTTRVIPGMMELNGARIQFFDLPGLIEKGFLGRGGGKQILAASRVVNLFLLIVDQEHLASFLNLWSELDQAGFRLNQKPPQIQLKKTNKGGIKILGPSGLKKETIKEIAQEMGFKNAEISFLESGIGANQLIDALTFGRVYLPALIVINKTDLLSEKEKEKIIQELSSLSKKDILPDLVFVSAEKNKGLEELKEKIWEKLDLIGIYLKKKEKEEADRRPLILARGSKIRDLVVKVNTEWLEQVSSALVWGKKVKFPGQKVSLNYSLVDGDTVYLVK